MRFKNVADSRYQSIDKLIVFDCFSQRDRAL